MSETQGTTWQAQGRLSQKLVKCTWQVREQETCVNAAREFVAGWTLR